jgi:hypothetical protein
MTPITPTTTTITLDYPVTVKLPNFTTETFKTLTIRRPRIIDFLNKEKHALAEPVERACNVRFVAALCDVPEEVIYELDEFADYEKLIKAVDSFLPKTGDATTPTTSAALPAS